MSVLVGTIACEFLEEHLALFDFSLKAQVLASRRLRAAFTGEATTTSAQEHLQAIRLLDSFTTPPLPV